MDSLNRSLQQALMAWSNGFLGSATLVLKILGQRTGITLSKQLPPWENRMEIFRKAADYQRSQLRKYSLLPELRQLFKALDAISGKDTRLHDVLSFHYLLQMDTPCLATLFDVQTSTMIELIRTGKEFMRSVTMENQR